MSTHFPDTGHIAPNPRPLPGPGDIGCADDASDRIQEDADAKYAVDRHDLWALSSQTDWLLYSPREVRHDPDAVAVLKLIESGADDADLGRIIRERVHSELKRCCYQMAVDEANGDL